MTKRRGNKEGTIYERPNGKWRAQISVSGHRVSFTGNTRAEAQTWLRHKGNQVEAGLTASGSKTTLAVFLDKWIDGSQTRIGNHSFRVYRQLTHDYIGPRIGKTKLSELSAFSIQEFYNQIIADGVGLRTVQKTHTLMHAALNSAVKFGFIARNPASAATPPKPPRKQMRFLTETQAQRLLQVAKQSHDRNFTLIFVALVTGMRQGELLGLRWQDVDLEKGFLHVRNNLQRLPGGGLVLQKPKTKASERAIKLGPVTVATLKTHKVKLASESHRTSLWQETGFVFPSTIGTAMDPSNLLKCFRQLLKTAELPKIRFHDLRHTAASLMLNNGVDVLVASNRLGHAKPSITLDVYGHLMPAIQAKAAEIMDGLVKP
jgi:integrase